MIVPAYPFARSDLERGSGNLGMARRVEPGLSRAGAGCWELQRCRHGQLLVAASFWASSPEQPAPSLNFLSTSPATLLSISLLPIPDHQFSLSPSIALSTLPFQAFLPSNTAKMVEGEVNQARKSVMGMPGFVVDFLSMSSTFPSKHHSAPLVLSYSTL